MNFSKDFRIKWDNEVKPQAVICSKGYDLLCKLEYDDLPEEEKIKIINKFKELNLKDNNTVWYIGKLLWAVEHALADNRADLNFLNATMQVKICLNAESYWLNVWENDFSTEEASNLKKLGGLMNDLINLN